MSDPQTRHSRHTMVAWRVTDLNSKARGYAWDVRMRPRHVHTLDTALVSWDYILTPMLRSTTATTGLHARNLYTSTPPQEYAERRIGGSHLPQLTSLLINTVSTLTLRVTVGYARR